MYFVFGVPIHIQRFIRMRQIDICFSNDISGEEYEHFLRFFSHLNNIIDVSDTTNERRNNHRWVGFLPQIPNQTACYQPCWFLIEYFVGWHLHALLKGWVQVPVLHIFWLLSISICIDHSNKCLWTFNRNLDRDIETSSKRWKKLVESDCPEKEKFPQEWKNKTPLQRLCMMRALRPDRMTYAVA